MRQELDYRVFALSTPKNGHLVQNLRHNIAADARVVEQAGADAIGLNCYPPSPRYIEPKMVGVLSGLWLAKGLRCL